MVRNSKVAIVILNYMNDSDTVECVDSTFALEGGPYDVIVVDNASPNGGYERLLEKYDGENHVTVLKTEKNLGFAKGNNLGIRCARKQKKADFVLVVNNDTVFTDPAYVRKMLAAYSQDVAILGSCIYLINGKQQGKYSACFAWEYCWKRCLNFCSEAQGGCFDFRLYKTSSTEILHGSVLLFTPAFFQKYKGFYTKTFLYHEEEILYLMCVRHGLRQKYVETTSIFHKEDQSSELSFGNDHQVKIKFYAQSYKWVLWWRLKVALLGKMPFDIKK